MKALQFTSVMRDANRADAESTAIREWANASASYALSLHENGGLAATRLEHGERAPIADRSIGAVVGFARHCCNARDPVWVFVVCASNVALNGSSPLAVALVEPGGLLAIGDRCWLISSLWQPEPVDAPAELRDKPCPVCGGDLGLAPVVQCGCGRWTHLENAAAPHDKDALNCFIAPGTCGGCGRPALLKPQLFPEVSDRLADEWVDEDETYWRKGDCLD